MSTRAGKRPVKSLPAQGKLEAIRRVHEGESKASVARDIGVPESTLRGWCKNEEKISFLSRQSSPDTDESLDSKRIRLEDPTMQPFNLSLKSTSNGTSFSPNAENRFTTPEINNRTEPEAVNAPLNLNIKNETTKISMDHMTERERNRAELARMSVELGLNRPEMFIPTVQQNNNPLMAELSANIKLLAHWNNALLQHQKIQYPSKHKMTTPGDTNTHTVSSTGLLTTVDQNMNKHLSKEQQSVNDSIWNWLRTQQNKLSLHQNNVPTTSNGATTSTATPMSTSSAFAGLTSEQSSWFWNCYKEMLYPQLNQTSTPDKPILYQQLTKETQKVSDQQNAENLSVIEDRSLNNKTNNNTKARAVLDNLLLNNYINVAVNDKKDGKEDGELSHFEALEHGEKFLKWLEACSDPTVTAVQIMQFKTLLNNVRSGAERKIAEQQNKTKVKRK